MSNSSDDNIQVYPICSLLTTNASWVRCTHKRRWMRKRSERAQHWHQRQSQSCGAPLPLPHCSPDRAILAKIHDPYRH